MEMKRTSDLLSGILMELPGCPSVTAAQSLLRAAQEWYRETLTWRHESEFVTAEGVRIYVLTPPACSHIVLLQAIVDDKSRVVDVPYTFDGGREVMFAESVAAGKQMTASFFLCPSNSTHELPCSDASRYLHVWEHGALAKLRMQKDQPWYSPQDASFHANRFASGVVASRINAARGYETGSIRVRPNQFM